MATVLVPAYPTEFPTAAIQVLISTIKNQVDFKLGIQAGWILVGYGLGVTLPPPAVTGAVCVVHQDPETELLQHLEKLAEVNDHPTKYGLVVPWATIIALIIQLIQKWLVK